MSDLPELPLEPWEPTKRTLHLWTQIVGKVRLASTAPQNHWWNATLYVDTRGLTTRRLRSPNGDFDVLFDFLGHKLVVHTSRGGVESFALEDGLSVAAFHDHLFASLRNLGIEVEIEAKPYGVPMTTPFAEDTEHASYDREAVSASGRRFAGSTGRSRNSRAGSAARRAPCTSSGTASISQ